jgi:hypothetical protein
MGRKAVDVRAERVDGAGDVDARGVWQFDRDRTLHVAAADVRVDAVERGPGHPQPHLPGARSGLVDVLVAQDAGAAELVETYCLHCRASLSGSLRLRSTS